MAVAGKRGGMLALWCSALLMSGCSGFAPAPIPVTYLSQDPDVYKRQADGGVVVAAHLGEKQEGGKPHDPQLQVQLGEEPEHGHADEDTGEGAEHPLHQTTAGGAVARLADEQYGEQDPVCLLYTSRCV